MLSRRTLLPALVALAIGAVAVTPSAQAFPLLDGLGGPANFGTGVLESNDDGSTERIDIGPFFPSGLHFYAGSFRAMFVNNNGNITFQQRLGTFTPAPFPVANQPMIAPWWGDVDTRGPGFPGANGVFWSLSRGRLVVSWHNVGYFNIHDDKRNDFQLIVTDRSEIAPGDFDAEFRYARCEWTTGDASQGMNGFGGVPAQAGFDAGDRVNFFTLPGSRTMGILDVCRTSNVDVPGRWIFSIRNGQVGPPDNVMVTLPDGGQSLLLEGRAGPCFCTVPGALPSHRARHLEWIALALAMVAAGRTRDRGGPISRL